MSIIGGPTTYDPQEYDRRRQELVKFVPSSQEELPHRKMMDSFDSALIPLGMDLSITGHGSASFPGHTWA